MISLRLREKSRHDWYWVYPLNHLFSFSTNGWESLCGLKVKTVQNAKIGAGIICQKCLENRNEV